MLLQRARKAHAAFGVRVAAVHDAVHPHGHARTGGHIADGFQMPDMAVHAAVREQARQMQPAAALFDRFQQPIEHRVGGKGAVLQGHVDTRHVLVDHAPGPDVQVAHLGIAHVAFRQAHGPARGRQLRMRATSVEVVQIGSGREIRRIAGSGRGQAPAVKNQQQGGGHAEASPPGPAAEAAWSEARAGDWPQRASRRYSSRTGSRKMLMTMSFRSTRIHCPAS